MDTDTERTTLGVHLILDLRLSRAWLERQTAQTWQTMLMRLAAKAKLTQLTVASAGDRKKALTVMLYSSMGHISLHTQPAQGYAAVDMFVGHDLPRLTVRDGVLALAVSVIRSYGGQVIRRAL